MLRTRPVGGCVDRWGVRGQIATNPGRRSFGKPWWDAGRSGHHRNSSIFIYHIRPGRVSRPTLLGIILTMSMMWLTPPNPISVHQSAFPTQSHFMEKHLFVVSVRLGDKVLTYFCGCGCGSIASSIFRVRG